MHICGGKNGSPTPPPLMVMVAVCGGNDGEVGLVIRGQGWLGRVGEVTTVMKKYIEVEVTGLVRLGA